MKRLFIISMAAAAISVSALDITTLDGKTYKNVSVSSITPVGFDISYTAKNGAMVLRGLKFTNLPEKIRKKFHYDPAKAAAFEKKCKLYQKQLIHKRIGALQQSECNTFLNDYEHIKALVYARRMSNIYLNIEQSANGGVVATCQSEQATLTTGQYGTVFVYGLTGGEGASWNGTIYPTGTWVTLTTGKYPAYSTSLDMATISVRNQIQLKSREKKK